MENNLPLVSIIIINWNGGKVLEDCLNYLSKIKYPNTELIIVDNGSTDGSLNFLKNQSIKLIKNHKNLGFAPANNQALKFCHGKYILLLNNDTKVHPIFLNLLVSKMESDPKIGVIQPKIFLMDKPGYLDNAGSFFTRIGFLEHWGFGRKDGSEFNVETEIFSAKGACMLIRKEVVNKVGLFDEDFFSYFEESDFCWRVWLAGWRIIYFPKTFIYHKLGFTIRRLNVGNLNFHYYKNRIASLIKNLEFKNLIIILPTHLLISIGIAVAFLIKLQPKNSWMIVKAIWWNLISVNKIIKKRQKVQSLRKLSDDIIFHKLMHPINWKQYFQDFKRIEEDIKRPSI